nr:NF038122 family metalloprotease [uncultured Roseateles sp.]
MNIVAAAAALACVAPASALNIVLHDTTGGFSSSANGAAALLSFQKAANYWNKTLTNDVTINIEIGFKALATGVLGSTASYKQDVSVADTYHALKTTGTSALDAIATANLTPLNANGSLAMRVNPYKDVANHWGYNNSADVGSVLNNKNGYLNQVLYANQSVVKALGLSGAALNPAQKYDATINFSSNFGFDFDPRNGIGNGLYDFTAVATHELGHALGFVSGTDYFDLYGFGKFQGQQGPYAQSLLDGKANLEQDSLGSTLDLFRYGNAVNGDGTYQLMWAANKTAFFSIDRKHVFNLPDVDQESAFFSTGRYTGDGQQASHWKDNLGAVDAGSPTCILGTRAVGIMDPTSGSCDMGEVTQNDLAAFDAMGWNTSVDVLASGKYSVDSKQIFEMPGVAAVPEPATWAQLLLGVGLIGGLLNRRRKAGDAA